MTVKADFTQVDKLMTTILNGLKNMSKPFNEMGNQLIKFFGDENFQAQGGKLGTQWSPLAVSTLQARARRYGHYKNNPKSTNQILVWTGALQKGFKKSVESTRLTIDNNVSYFDHNIQTRAMLGINSNVIKIIEDVTSDYLDTLTK